VKTTPKIVMKGSNRIKYPVATLISMGGSICQIIIDDGCYLVCFNEDDGTYDSGGYHISQDVFEVLKTLPPLT
jgi:hypothetical protein